MSYEFTVDRLPNFFRYVNKVYGFSEMLKTIKGNEDAQVSGKTIFMSMFIGTLLRFGSIRQIASDVKDGKLNKFLPEVDKETFCANTISNGLAEIDIEGLQRDMSIVPKKLRRNGAYGTTTHPRVIGGLKICALDGTEIYRSESIHCPECQEYHIMTENGIVTHYVHKVVIMYTVGRMHESAVQTILGVESTLPKDASSEDEPGHEGESTAAKRLIKKMIDLYGNVFFDVLSKYATIFIFIGSYCCGKVGLSVDGSSSFGSVFSCTCNSGAFVGFFSSFRIL